MANDANPVDGWAQHQRDQARGWMRLSPEERLEWLEGALDFAREYLGVAAHRRAPDPCTDPDTQGS